MFYLPPMARPLQTSEHQDWSKRFTRAQPPRSEKKRLMAEGNGKVNVKPYLMWMG